MFSYCLVDLAAGSDARRTFNEAMAAVLAPTPRSGVFTPQLGWDNSAAAVLAERDVAAAVAASPKVTACRSFTLTPTLRPRPGDQLVTGGIYVHRWFEVRRDDHAEFVALSGEAWPEFEAGFETKIFGLFDAASRPGEDTDTSRLLLLTWYANHATWEASRTPSPTARAAFQRRAEITVRTRAASSLLV